MAKKRKLKKKSRHNVFDNVYHTLATKMSWMIIPIINMIYGINIPLSAVIIQLRNEFYEKEGTYITDSLYLIDGRIFHFECQSLADPTMSVRMFRYDTLIATEYACKSEDEYCLTYPVSAVIYLRPDNRKGRHSVNLSFPDGTDAKYHTSIINVHDYTKEDIFEKKLFLFLPFYILRYEKLFRENTYDNAWIDELLYEFAVIRDRLYNEFPEDRGLCNDIFELIIQISDYILRNHNTIKERMREIMGGEILELYSERMARLEKEISERAMTKGLADGMAKGIAQGITQGIAQGISQGISQGIAQVITNMLKLNMPFETISAATGYSHEQILDISKSLQAN